MQLSRQRMSDSSTDHREGEVGVEDLACWKLTEAAESDDCACLISKWSLSISIIALAWRVGPSRNVVQRDVESCSCVKTGWQL